MGHILIQNVYFLQNKFNNKCTLTDLCPKCTLLGATSVLGISLGVYQTRKERNILFNDAVVVYLHLYGVRCTQIAREEGRKEMLYLTTHSTHFIYGYMASDIWLRTILIVRKKTHCRHICYSFRLTPVVEHWLEREIANWVHPMKDRSDDPSHHERTLLPRS